MCPGAQFRHFVWVMRWTIDVWVLNMNFSGNMVGQVSFCILFTQKRQCHPYVETVLMHILQRHDFHKTKVHNLWWKQNICCRQITLLGNTRVKVLKIYVSPVNIKCNPGILYSRRKRNGVFSFYLSPVLILVNSLCLSHCVW